MAPLIQVISEEDSRRRLSPRDILSDVVIIIPSPEELISYNSTISSMNSKQIQMVLFKLASYFHNGAQTTVQNVQLLEFAEKVVCSATALQLWRNKCLLLLIANYLCNHEKWRERIVTYIRTIFPGHLFSDPHEEIRTCFYQFIEVLIQHKKEEWIEWYFAYYAKSYSIQSSKEPMEPMEPMDPWMRWMNQFLPKELAITTFSHINNLTVDSIQYELLVHYDLDVCIGMLLQKTTQRATIQTILNQLDCILPHVSPSYSIHSLPQWKGRTNTLSQHIAFLFYTIGTLSELPFPTHSLSSQSIPLLQSSLLCYYWHIRGRMDSTFYPVQPDAILLHTLELLHSLHVRDYSETQQSERLLWRVLDDLLTLRQGKWLSGQLANRLLFVHFFSTQHSLTSIESLFPSRRSFVSFLGNEGLQTVGWLMRYNQPMLEETGTHYVQDYLLDKKNENKPKTISYIQYILQNTSLSTNAGNSGLFCKWLMKLLFWNNTSTEESQPLFESLCQSMASILKEAPALCLLNYYSQLLVDLLHILSFNRAPSSIQLLYALFIQLIDRAMKDQTDPTMTIKTNDKTHSVEDPILSSIAMEAIHQYITQFPTLSINAYALHVEQCILLFSHLPAAYYIPEIQSILNLLESGFSNTTRLDDAIANVHLLHCLCNQCPHRMGYYMRTLMGYGLDCLVYGGKMREVETIKEFHASCIQFWLVLLKMDPSTVQSTLGGFYDRIKDYSIDRVYDIRDELRIAFADHIQEDGCNACKLHFPLSF